MYERFERVHLILEEDSFQSLNQRDLPISIQNKTLFQKGFKIMYVLVVVALKSVSVVLQQAAKGQPISAFCLVPVEIWTWCSREIALDRVTNKSKVFCR